MIITNKLRLCFLLTLAVFASGTVIAEEALAGSWFNEDWRYRQKITINPDPAGNDLVPSQQNHFPVLIKITDQNNSIFGNALSNGDDILFTASDGTTKLDP